LQAIGKVSQPCAHNPTVRDVDARRAFARLEAVKLSRRTKRTSSTPLPRSSVAVGAGT